MRLKPEWKRSAYSNIYWCEHPNKALDCGELIQKSLIILVS